MPAPSTFRCVALALASLLALACTQPAGESAGESAPESSATPAATTAESPAAARYGDRTISVEEVDDFIKDQLFRRATDDGDPVKTWTARRDAVTSMIDQELVEAAAAEAGLSANDLLRREVEQRNTVTPEAVQAFYDENQERIGRPIEEIRPQIEQHLKQQNLATVRDAYLATLREGQEIEVLIDAPRTEVAATGPSLGPDDAPVTIVEFSDYQCPFCRRVEPTIEALLARYPEQVRFVYRHYPLDRIHPQARGAAEAAACADDQGQFWAFHKQLFAEGAKFDAQSLEGYAEQTGLDLAEYKACVAERRHKDLVENDFQDGAKAGVTGTPAFFVNGIMMSGARPLEEFVQLIEEELADS
ncbi:MAG: DsbA family protein [Myxococcota bacterium]|nr:DsbA family protein [Myxococcota bacterium]